MMYLNELMAEKNMTRAELSRISCIPESTLRDILNGKAQIDRCEAGTLYNIADVLDTTVEEIISHYWDESLLEDDFDEEPEKKYVHDSNTLLTFYTLVNAVIQALDTGNDFDFAFFITEERMIEKMYSTEYYREALFLLGLVDYVYRKYDIPKESRFDAYRNSCLDCPVYALSTLEEYDDPDVLEEAKLYAESFAIPELAAFNIFMTEEDISPED